jgi:hypothetical protein
MARQYVDDGAAMFRVVVTSKKNLGRNPAYDWRTARETGEPPYLYSETETETAFFGPYKTAGTASAQARFHSTDGYGDPHPAVVGAHVERANIVWEVQHGTSVQA